MVLKRFLFMLLSFGVMIPQSQSSNSQAIQKKCQSDQVEELQKNNATLVDLANQLRTYTDILKVIQGNIVDSKSAQPWKGIKKGLNPAHYTMCDEYSSDCPYKAQKSGCPTFSYPSIDFSKLQTFSGSVCKDSCECSDDATLNSMFSDSYKYSPFISGFCSSSGNWDVVCGESSLSSDNACNAKNNFTAQIANFAPLNPITIDGSQFYGAGCNCSSFNLSIENYNTQSQIGPSFPKNQAIFFQCPICEHIYEVGNNIILLKYEILNFIYNQLQDSNVAEYVNKILTNCDSSSCSASSSDSSSSTQVPPSIAKAHSLCNLCCKKSSFVGSENCKAQEILNKPILPKKRQLTVPKEYIYDDSTSTKHAEGDKKYCMLVDLNMNISSAKLLNLLNLVGKAFQDYGDELKNSFSECTNYLNLKAAQQNTQILSEKAQLYNLQLQAADLGKQVALMSRAQMALGLAMMPAMMVMPKLANLLKLAVSKLITSSAFKAFGADIVRVLKKPIQTFLKGGIKALGRLADKFDRAGRSITNVVNEVADQISSDINQSVSQAYSSVELAVEDVNKVIESVSKSVNNVVQFTSDATAEVAADATEVAADAVAEGAAEEMVIVEEGVAEALV